MLDFKPMTDSQTEDAAHQPATSRGIFEPPSGLVFTAISRNKRIVVAIAVIFALVGVGVGATRKPTYTAVTTLKVGTVSLTSPSLAGFVDGASAFATVFSRAILAAPVLATLQTKLGLTPTDTAS